ncbi:MAG: hypothetical protein ACKO66_10675 [Flavobacteriales bacterium]
MNKALAALIVIFIAACDNKKDCPGFPGKLTPYIPQESQLVFYNPSGDSLVFLTPLYDITAPRTLKRNVFSVGGTGSKPYCTSSCGINSSYVSSDANQLGYSINSDDESDTCSVNINISSSLGTIDYFYAKGYTSSSARVFGDTLRLTNFVLTTVPRFSQVEIVYGRGIIKLQDDVLGCTWSR